jgi:hypothetical protein
MQHMTERVIASIKGKTVENIEYHAPNLRITFTDGSYLDLEAVECGDVRSRYHPSTEAEPKIES